MFEGYVEKFMREQVTSFGSMRDPDFDLGDNEQRG